MTFTIITLHLGYLFESLLFECKKSDKLLISMRGLGDTDGSKNEFLSVDDILKDVECDDEEYDYDNIDENTNYSSASFKLFLIADIPSAVSEIQINVRNSLLETSMIKSCSEVS
jgi:hypothetical protein